MITKETSEDEEDIVDEEFKELFRASLVENCVIEYLRKESGVDVEEISSDESDNNFENDDVEEKITMHEALTMIGRLINLKGFNIEERTSLSSLKDRIEIIRVRNLKQQSIKNIFSK